MISIADCQLLYFVLRTFYQYPSPSSSFILSPLLHPFQGLSIKLCFYSGTDPVTRPLLRFGPSARIPEFQTSSSALSLSLSLSPSLLLLDALFHFFAFLLFSTLLSFYLSTASHSFYPPPGHDGSSPRWPRAFPLSALCRPLPSSHRLFAALPTRPGFLVEAVPAECQERRSQRCVLHACPPSA